MDDTRALVERAQRGDKEAFGELFKAYYEPIFRLLYGIVGNREDARDLGQQTWIKAWKNLNGYRGEAAFSSWIYRIATFTAWDFLRRRKRSPEVPAGDWLDEIPSASGEGSPAESLNRKEFRVRFKNALAMLPQKQRTVLILRETEGLSYKEIAGIMKCRTGTVMSRLFHARKSMQNDLEDLR